MQVPAEVAGAEAEVRAAEEVDVSPSQEASASEAAALRRRRRRRRDAAAVLGADPREQQRGRREAPRESAAVPGRESAAAPRGSGGSRVSRVPVSARRGGGNGSSSSSRSGGGRGSSSGCCGSRRSSIRRRRRRRRSSFSPSSFSAAASAEAPVRRRPAPRPGGLERVEQPRHRREHAPGLRTQAARGQRGRGAGEQREAGGVGRGVFRARGHLPLLRRRRWSSVWLMLMPPPWFAHRRCCCCCCCSDGIRHHVLSFPVERTTVEKENTVRCPLSFLCCRLSWEGVGAPTKTRCSSESPLISLTASFLPAPVSSADRETRQREGSRACPWLRRALALWSEKRPPKRRSGTEARKNGSEIGPTPKVFFVLVFFSFSFFFLFFSSLLSLPPPPLPPPPLPLSLPAFSSISSKNSF